MQTHTNLRSFLLPSTLLAAFYALASAAPLLSPQSSSCSDLNAPWDSDCYRALNLSDFLNNTSYGWNATRGMPCESGDNAAYCCRSTDVTWSACFVRQAVQLAGKPSCDSINSTTCPTTSFDIVPEVDTSNQRKYQYILHNIYCKFAPFDVISTRCTGGQY